MHNLTYHVIITGNNNLDCEQPVNQDRREYRSNSQSVSRSHFQGLYNDPV